MYYDDNKQQAKELIGSLIIDGWTQTEIEDYFMCLGHDLFFLQEVVKPFFINPSP
jgi:hypothetical protein